MGKIQTLDGLGFWKDAYAHNRAKLLKMVDVPEDQILTLVNIPYMELSTDLRYRIETSGIDLKQLR